MDGTLPVFQRIGLAFAFDGPFAELPDIFIYVVSGDKTFTYLRVAPNDRIVNDHRYSDCTMKVEKCSNPDGKYHEAGFINLRVAFNSEYDWHNLWCSTPEGANEPDISVWKEEPSQDMNNVRNIQIFPNLYMGKNLISADDDGLCDPVVTFYHHGVHVSSSIYMDSLNPVWNERMLIYGKAFGKWIPPVIVKAYDQDQNLIAKDDYECLGVCKVQFSLNDIKLRGDVNEIPPFKTYQIVDDTKLETASLTMSFTVVQHEGGINPMTIKPMLFKRDSYLIKLHILGLRNLQSPGMFNVKNPYIKFHTGSLKNSGNSKGGSAYDILTAKCKKGGPNPSFSELMT